MSSHRTTARGLLLLALFGFAAGTAAARPDPPAPRLHPARAKKPSTNQIVFPVLGQVQYTDDFGAPRAQGPHQGNDIMASRRALALAAEAGRVRFTTGSRRAGCMLYLDGKSGTTYVYIHLNNDLTMRNDNRGGCVNGLAFPKGLRSGAAVEAGQPVGFVGDSGDADGIHPHLHFEVHPGGGAAISPYPLLRSALRLLFYAPAGSSVTLALSGRVVSTGVEALRLKVNTLRVAPTGLKLRKLGRALIVSVPVGVLVERSAPGGSAVAASLAGARPGEAVTVWTEQAVVTPDMLAGKEGVLAAEHVLLPVARG